MGIWHVFNTRMILGSWSVGSVERVHEVAEGNDDHVAIHVRG